MRMIFASLKSSSRPEFINCRTSVSESCQFSLEQCAKHVPNVPTFGFVYNEKCRFSAETMWKFVSSTNVFILYGTKNFD